MTIISYYTGAGLESGNKDLTNIYERSIANREFEEEYEVVHYGYEICLRFQL